MNKDINKRVLEVRGNSEELNKFMEEFKPFIISTAEKTLNRYVDCKNDEEWSIALLAFNEAIVNYEINKGSFLSFSKMVIKARLIDYYRKESKYKNMIYINKISEEEEEIDLSEKQAIDEYHKENSNEYRKIEIQQLTEELKKWDITFKDLVKASPKRTATRKIYNTIIDFILNDEKALNYVLNKKTIPIAEIEKNTLVPRKKIERSRKYIISVLLIILGDYEYLKEYVNLEEQI
ncbi:RNA polymerase sigma factor [Clostridium punense]|uniref:RNA polymerase sigma factor SigI n=1 Tax=Clostridium punense TaxID=1054297 RepID=A0ABS4K0U3_9CLOT|nr:MULTISPECIES: RNA polymerase sigma-I factor [Clostridium]EQB87575.1 hypothetical protein M918_08450 [Clostridium sp. BL8]MBP2021398.1 RNA polymerase sigma factor [Clostridium punense]